MIYIPCIDCYQEYEGCHKICPAYAEYKVEIERVATEMMEEEELSESVYNIRATCSKR